MVKLKTKTKSRITYFIVGSIVSIILFAILLYFFNFRFPILQQSIANGSETGFIQPEILGGLISAIGGIGAVVLGEVIRKRR